MAQIPGCLHVEQILQHPVPPHPTTDSTSFETLTQAQIDYKAFLGELWSRSRNYVIPQSMENQMEKNVENEMETGVI